MVINGGFYGHDKRQCWHSKIKMASRHTLFSYVDQLAFFIGGSTVFKRASNTCGWRWGSFWWWSTAVFIAKINANVDAFEIKWRCATPFFAMLINLTVTLVAQRYSRGPASTRVVEDEVVFFMVINSGFYSQDKRQCWRFWNKMASRHTLFCYVDQLDCYYGGSTVFKRACINTYRWGCGCFLMVINGGFHSNDERHVLTCCSRANSKLLLDNFISTVDLRLVTGTLINRCFLHRHYRVLSPTGDQRPKNGRWSTAKDWPVKDGQKKWPRQQNRRFIPSMLALINGTYLRDGISPDRPTIHLNFHQATLKVKAGPT